MKTNMQIVEQMISKCQKKIDKLSRDIVMYNKLICEEEKIESMYKLMYAIDTRNGTEDNEFLFNFPDSYLKLIAKRETLPPTCGHDYATIYNVMMHNVKSRLENARNKLADATKELEEACEEDGILDKASELLFHMENLS